MERKLKEICLKLADELEIALEHRLLYKPDPKEFELIREAREACGSGQPALNG